MTKFSSFKEQQLITESWRNYNNISEAQVEPVKTQATQQPTSAQATITQQIEQSAKSSPFIKMMNTASPQDQFFVLQQFLNKITIKDPKTFYTNLSNTALKLKDTKSQTANPVQPVDKQAIKQQNSQQPVKQALEESIYDDATLEDGTLVCGGCLQELLESDRTILQEAKYQGKTVTLNKPFLTPDGPKKRSVYVKNSKTGNVKKVSFGDPNMRIKKNIPARRKSFRARHKCESPGPKTKAKYWSCRAWE